MVENLHEDSLIAQRIIYDACKAVGGPSEVPITSEMLNFARFARTRYRTALEKKKKDMDRKNASGAQAKKRAKVLFHELQAKRAALRAQTEAEDQFLLNQMLEVRKNLE